ncbi:MAG: exopolyphosphatase [Chitinophagales bacterium]
MKTKKYAAIDIGSNAMRLLINNVIEAEDKVYFKKVAITRVPIRLGTEAFVNKKISDANIKRMLYAMKAFANLMKVHDVEKYRACATSAMRDAKNGAEIIAKIKAETDIAIEIISGEEEAEIIFATHIEKLINKPLNFLYLDVGGGSAECTLFSNGEIVTSKSFNIGTIRLLNNLVTELHWKEMRNWLKDVTKDKKINLIGSGGNINKVFKLSRKAANEALSLGYIENYLEELKKYSYEERVLKLDLNLDRADVIIPALTIFTSVMKWTNAQDIYVPKIGLADGIIKTLLYANA